MFVNPATEPDIAFVVKNLRDIDRHELQATGCVLPALPGFLLRHSAFCFMAYDPYFQVPHAIWGVVPTRQGVGNAYAFGTNHWDKAVPSILRNVRRWARPFALAHFHRLECAALSSRKDVTRFLAMLGAKPEAVMRSWGAGGEDFTSYRWLADEYRSKAAA